MIWQGESRTVGDEEHRNAMIVSGHGCLHRLPGHAIERGIADRLYVSPEAVLILPCASLLTCCQASSLVKSVRTKSEEFGLGNVGMGPSISVRRLQGSSAACSWENYQSRAVRRSG